MLRHRAGPGARPTPARCSAEVVLRATEGYTAAAGGAAARGRAGVLADGRDRAAADDARGSRSGSPDRPTFSDGRHLIIYGQRTADGRLAFGGRGAPYHFGSRIRPSYDAEPRVFEDLRAVLREHAPAAAATSEFTHQWGGCLGIARDWAASVGLDRRTGIGWAGGYVGDGVATTNLAGRTLADLVTGADSDLVTLPWVNHRSRPLGARAAALAGHQRRPARDDLRRRRGAPGPGGRAVIARMMAPLTGGH